MKSLISIFEIMICMNLLFAVSAIFIRKIILQKKPSYQLHLARLLFMSCVLSPIAVHFINLSPYDTVTNIAPGNVIKEYHSIKNKIYENIDEITIPISSKPKVDLSYLYLILSMILASGLLLRTYRIARDINKTKFIIDSAQPYKKNRKISIKISDKCAVPFSIRLIQTSYIILPVSILHSSINTKLAIAHEGQHHRQGDCLWEYVMEFTRIIFWFNPFINYWHQYFQELQELACDETLVSKKMVSAHDYGSCLFNVSQAASKYLHVHHQNLACTSQMISGREIETSLITRRICMLSKYKNDHLTKTMLGYIFTISALSVMGPLGAAYAAKGLLSQGAKLHSIDTSSIDPKMQIIAAKEISRVVRNSHAKSGAIVIADAHSGKIVAFAESGKSTGNDSWKSRVFNPASTIKPFIAAAAIDAGVVSEATIYDCHSLYQVGGKEITNGDAKAGNLSVADAMVSSNNICMVKVAQNTGSAKTRQTLTRFGFDMNTAWDNNNSDALNLANAALGFSIPVTLGTLTDAFTILANKGHFITANSGSAVSESTAKSVTHLLEKAVTEGTGKHAAIANVLVAGKTGTLSIPAHTSRLALFAGYVPSNSPRYVSIIVIENPIMDGSSANANGGNVAAPVFRNVFEKSLAMSK